MLRETTQQELRDFIGASSVKNKIYVPDHNALFTEYFDEIVLDYKKTPTWGPLREFMLPLISEIDDSESGPENFVVLGARNCELVQINNILDKVFIDKAPRDMIYQALREKLILVSADCREPADTCFCVSMGLRPYSEGNCDACLSFLGQKVILEYYTEKGRSFFSSLKTSNLSSGLAGERESARQTSVKNLNVDNDFIFSAGAFRKKMEEEDISFWDTYAENCIECGACCYNCSSCYCSILLDNSKRNKVKKERVIDTCQQPGYAAMSSGYDPLSERSARFRHRFICKLIKIYEEFGVPGCTGCGRCIRVCPGRIDIRDIIRERLS